MRASVRCACCPGGAARAQKEAPPAEGGGKEDATASHDMAVLAQRGGTLTQVYTPLSLLALADPNRFCNLPCPSEHGPHYKYPKGPHV